MKKLPFLMVLLAMVSANVCHAQDAKAKSIMEKVSANLKNAKSVNAQFTMSVNDAQGKSRLQKSGTFQMKGNQYKISLNGGQEIICDGKFVWTYLPENKEVQISNYNPAEQTISPSTLFSGSYEKDYNCSYSGNKTISNQKVEVITLKPKKQHESFTKAELYINPVQNMITGGHIYAIGGTSYSYTISHVNTRSSIGNKVFHFNPKSHPGVEVIDLR